MAPRAGSESGSVPSASGSAASTSTLLYADVAKQPQLMHSSKRMTHLPKDNTIPYANQEIDLQTIRNGNDKRTSIMVRNIPNRYGVVCEQHFMYLFYLQYSSSFFFSRTQSSSS